MRIDLTIFQLEALTPCEVLLLVEVGPQRFISSTGIVFTSMVILWEVNVLDSAVVINPFDVPLIFKSPKPRLSPLTLQHLVLPRQLSWNVPTSSSIRKKIKIYVPHNKHFLKDQENLNEIKY